MAEYAGPQLGRHDADERDRCGSARRGERYQRGSERDTDDDRVVLRRVSLAGLDDMPAFSGGNALAVLDEAEDMGHQWATAAEYARKLLPQLDDLPAQHVLNLNVSDRPVDEVAGLKRAELATFGQVQMAVAESGEDFVRTALQQSRTKAEPDTDPALLTAGYATLTTLRAVTVV